MGYPGYGAGYVSPEQIEAQQRALDEARREDHSQDLHEHRGQIQQYQRANEQFPLQTNFNSHDLDGLKSMLADANPDGVDQVGNNWKRVHDKLVGAGGGSPSGDSAYGQLKKAVDDVLEHWEGESATQFKAKAEKILQQIANSATHAHNAHEVMTAASKDLRQQKDEIGKLEKPGFWGSVWDTLTDGSHDDKYTEQDVKNGNLPKDVVAKINENHLGAEKEVQLKAVSIMENLGRSYVGYGKRLAAPVDNGKDEIPPSNPSTPMPTPIPAMSGSTATPNAAGAARTSTSQAATANVPGTTGPRDPAISGGQQVPASQTKVDSVPSGITGGTGGAGTGTVSGAGAGGGVGSVGGGAVAGVPGGAVAGGAAAAAGAARGAAGAGRGVAGAAGRSGMVGGGAMGGRGGAAAGIGGKGAAGAAGRGALAKTKGGVVGAPKGIVGGKPATPGGTGLGKGRAGAAGAAGAAGGRKGAGMFGGARGTNQRPDEEERTEGQRPDYLVEDEETWVPEDNRSVPDTIE